MAEAFGGGAHDLRAAVVPADVGDDAVEAIAGAQILSGDDVLGGLLRFVERRPFEIDGHDARAGFEEAERHHPAEPASRAGDDRDLTVECSGHAPSSFRAIRCRRIFSILPAHV